MIDERIPIGGGFNPTEKILVKSTWIILPGRVEHEKISNNHHLAIELGRPLYPIYPKQPEALFSLFR